MLSNWTSLQFCHSVRPLRALLYDAITAMTSSSDFLPYELNKYLKIVHRTLITFSILTLTFWQEGHHSSVSLHGSSHNGLLV